MTLTASRFLVVDASVAGQAGSEGARDPRSVHCHNFLLQILQICHCIVMSEAIRKEWNKHASPRARKWLTQMHGAKKVEKVETPEDAVLRRRLIEIAASSNATDAAVKDVHLVEAALASDGLIVSMDDEARSLFRELSRQAKQIRHLVWINPAVEEETPIAWLKAGAPTEEHRKLGFRSH